MKIIKCVTQSLSIAAVAAIAMAAGGPAAAQSETQLIGGWDFAQFGNLGFLSIDGATLVNALDANHSDLDPTNGCGIESNAFGTMHVDGQFGSTSVPLTIEGPHPFQPTDVPPNSSLLSNADQALLGFGSQSGTAACNQAVLENMPGANCSNVAMAAYDGVNVVFEADRGAAGPDGEWSVSFAGKTLIDGNATVTVSFAPDGGSYSNVGTAQLTAVDTEYSFHLGAPTSDTAYVRLSFGTAEIGSEPTIDNLGIAVPEPAGGALAGIFALGALRLARRRA